MRPVYSLYLSFILIIWSPLSGCRNRHETYSDNGSSIIGDNTEESIPIFHNWRELSLNDFLFDAPSEEQAKKWESLCEERNAKDSVSKRYLTDSFADMNQMITIHDFIELWYHENSYMYDDDLTTWRLMQYDEEMSGFCDSEFDRFSRVKNAIQSLLLYSPMSQMDINFHSHLEQNFKEYYNRLMVREAIRHSDKRLANSLDKEQKDWIQYQNVLGTSFQMIIGDPNGMEGSSWPMAICGILDDNAQMREISLSDFYFALTDNLDYEFAHKRSPIGEYNIEKHSEVKDIDVSKEYQRFIELTQNEKLFYPEYHHTKSDMRKALIKERAAWDRWISSRKNVSSCLEGLCKDVYDNATNNVRRYKLIMLKNRYQGYGLIGRSVEECLLGYSCKDEEITKFAFEKRWKGFL